MRSYPIKTPKIVQYIFKRFIWNIPTNKKEIYLTFDDGPIPEITPWVLRTLEKYNAKATFFCVGENLMNHSKIHQDLLDMGHSLGNHTFNHLNGWKTDKEEYIQNIERAEKILSQQNSNKERSKLLFRPPYGKINTQQSKILFEKGYKIIMWDILSGDFDQKLSKEACLNNVIKNTRKGSIVVFHDNEKAFKNLFYALPKTLEYFTQKGFVFKAL